MFTGCALLTNLSLLTMSPTTGSQRKRELGGLALGALTAPTSPRPETKDEIQELSAELLKEQETMSGDSDEKLLQSWKSQMDLLTQSASKAVKAEVDDIPRAPQRFKQLLNILITDFQKGL